MQEKINVDAIIESFETSKSHIRSISKISQAKLKALTADEWNARIEENQKFLNAEWKVILGLIYSFSNSFGFFLWRKCIFYDLMIRGTPKYISQK